MSQSSDKKQPAEVKRNCWEVLRCGREPGGAHAAEFDVCPAAVDHTYDGINSGKCAGRICWAVAGTLCDGCAHGSFIEKRPSCLNCDFYKTVQEEEKFSGRKTKFLQFIENDQRSPFFDRMTYRHVRAGERFVTQGAVEDKAYIIQRGSCLVIVEKDGVLYPVDHYGEGDIVGGLGILTGEPRRAHVEAETDMDLWIMTRAQFDEFTEKDPALHDFITELVADRFDSHRPTAYRTIGKYMTTDIIGRGAFSIVYRGVHKVLNMPVVIKMMRHDMAQYPEFIDSFHNEAKTIAGLSHEHIVKVYDFEERYRTLFIIMEYVKGETLKEMIAHLKTIPPQLAARFLVQTCSALAYAHRRGIIHRDINPSNMIVQPDDRIKIMDFGLACPAGTEDFSNLGTAAYMAPEQIAGDPMDARTDIYALGITAFEMATGRRPFAEENTKALMDLHLAHDVPDPRVYRPDLPSDLCRFIVTCGRKDPAERYQDMHQAMAALQSLVEDPRMPVREAGTDNRLRSGLCLTYATESRAQISQLVEEFRERAQALGVEIELLEAQTETDGQPQHRPCLGGDDPEAVRTASCDTAAAAIFAATRGGVPGRPNADRYVIRVLEDGAVLLAVADGLGGDVRGEHAAQMAAEELNAVDRIDKDQEEAQLDGMVRRIDRAVCLSSRSDPALANTGSTLTAVLLRDNLTHWVQVGDSRLYLLRGGRLRQITQDQTLARFLVREAHLTAQQAATHYSRNVMDQWVGCGDSAPETGRLEIVSGNVLILSSDGLHKFVPEDLLSAIAGEPTPLESRARKLIQTALAHGGADDITLVMVQAR